MQREPHQQHHNQPSGISRQSTAMPSKFSHYNGRIERETKEYGTSLTSTATTAIIFVRFSIVVGYVILCDINSF